MSSAEFDAKFPGPSTGLPPSPCIENPGRVFPKSDPSKAATPSPHRSTPDFLIGNPFLMNNALDKVDHAFNNIITILESEARSQDRSENGNPLLLKFKDWRDELIRIRSGEETLAWSESHAPVQEQEGGMFTD
ncbi:hypothetical protein B0H34DRAFT_720832 [Crassisporium funariophilum]|nr:hypothetical protein B0H34DRAFT_720832 [Crassisporium funariophilum]